jgi:hypothetical protein
MVKKILLIVLAVTMLSGCMGHGALTQKVVIMNLKATEHKWGREGIFLGLWIVPVYPICFFLDIIIFNSIEFWSGENSLNGKSPVVDLPMAAVQKMGFNDVNRARVERLTANNANLHIDFNNGDSATFDVIREDKNYTISYCGIEFYRGTLALL